MKKGKFTFKTEQPTGRYRSFENPIHYIKIKRKTVGRISEKSLSGLYRLDCVKIHFMVIKKDINEDQNPNCSWKWIILKRNFETVEEAKNWLNSDSIFEHLNKAFTFYYEKTNN